VGSSDGHSDACFSVVVWWWWCCCCCCCTCAAAIIVRAHKAVSNRNKPPVLAQIIQHTLLTGRLRPPRRTRTRYTQKPCFAL
jgi:hypothetical protein